ncbi:hypothetical protein [Embleya hyalina]|uniref:Uncharacterized protein n=1 Tax=Embleya hyalina TaxID=516124 RepID=A0A401YTJ5_9ACTN|nr:hypothetical protein [Embleya hyalina]GCD97875.1 hypothetical protein EHYA_05572 [Embleya hyalina]
MNTPVYDTHPVYQVDVPIRDPRTDTHGIHVLTGNAATAEDALATARHVYTQAVHHTTTGALPSRRPDGWGVRGLRPGWEPDWSGATCRPWTGTLETMVLFHPCHTPPRRSGAKFVEPLTAALL